MSENKSFTLIELLIVIGILAILVAAVVVILNPAQLLAQARDSKRQQDLSALNQALQTVSALDQSLSFGTASTVYTSLPDSTTTCATWNLPSLPSGWTYHCVATSTLQNTNGTGWIPVNFQSNGVVSLSALPTDPVNTSSTGLYYTYVSGGSFELNGILESSKYRNNSSLVAVNLPGVLAYGSNLSLSPIYNVSGLAGYYNFNEGSGAVANDVSGNGNNGAWEGSGNHYVGGKVGNYAGQFNGSDDDVKINASVTNTQSDLTVCAWAYVADQTVYRTVVSSHAFEFDNSGTSPTWTNGSSINYFYYVVAPPNQQWTHICMGRSSGLNFAYLNGVANYYPGSITYDRQSTQFEVGADISGRNAYRFKGYIDDVRIYNRALSASEIQALYNATK